MDVTVEEDGACRKTLKVEIPAEKVQSTFDQVAVDFVQHADLPGYRKGRAPAALVKNKYRKQIMEQVRDQLVPESYQEAIQDQAFEVANVLGATDPHMKLGDPLTFEVTVDAVPEFELPTYKGISVTRELKEIGDEDVKEVIERILAQQAEYFDREEGDAVEASDLVQIDYSGSLDGTPLADLELGMAMYASSTDFWAEASDQSIIPGLGTATIGMKAGEDATFNVDFPEAIAEEKLQGKSATYTVTVKAIRGRKIPELTDELASGMGVETADELRTKIRENLVQEATNGADAKLRNDLIDLITEPVQFAIPDSVVESETRSEIYNMVGRISRDGMNDNSITEHKDEIFQAANKTAQQRVKVQYVLKAIAKAEELKVDPEEFNLEVQQMAMQSKVSADEMINTIRERDAVGDVHDQILVRKTIDFLVAQAEVQG